MITLAILDLLAFHEQTSKVCVSGARTTADVRACRRCDGPHSFTNFSQLSFAAIQPSRFSHFLAFVLYPAASAMIGAHPQVRQELCLQLQVHTCGMSKACPVPLWLLAIPLHWFFPTLRSCKFTDMAPGSMRGGVMAPIATQPCKARSQRAAAVLLRDRVPNGCACDRSKGALRPQESLNEMLMRSERQERCFAEAERSTPDPVQNSEPTKDAFDLEVAGRPKCKPRRAPMWHPEAVFLRGVRRPNSPPRRVPPPPPLLQPISPPARPPSHRSRDCTLDPPSTLASEATAMPAMCSAASHVLRNVTVHQGVPEPAMPKATDTRARLPEAARAPASEVQTALRRTPSTLAGRKRGWAARPGNGRCWQRSASSERRGGQGAPTRLMLSLSLSSKVLVAVAFAHC